MYKADTMAHNAVRVLLMAFLVHAATGRPGERPTCKEGVVR